VLARPAPKRLGLLRKVRRGDTEAARAALPLTSWLLPRLRRSSELLELLRDLLSRLLLRLRLRLNVKGTACCGKRTAGTSGASLFPEPAPGPL
jgi:hypothetical protein